MKLLFVLFVLLSLAPKNLFAVSWKLVAGLSQPLALNGYNFEINYLTDSLVFEYSHGWDLDFSAPPDGAALTDEEKELGLDVFAPWSTGGGVGYRWTENFDTRVEYKQHLYKISRSNGEKFEYIVTELGIGAYYSYYPFGSEGLVIVPNIRYWPKIGSTLKDDKFYFEDGSEYLARENGLFINASIGYGF